MNERKKATSRNAASTTERGGREKQYNRREREEMILIEAF